MNNILCCKIISENEYCENKTGLYILEFSPPPVGGGKKSKGLEMGKEI